MKTVWVLLGAASLFAQPVLAGNSARNQHTKSGATIRDAESAKRDGAARHASGIKGHINEFKAASKSQSHKVRLYKCASLSGVVSDPCEGPARQSDRNGRYA
jgi:hypothetical protein